MIAPSLIDSVSSYSCARSSSETRPVPSHSGHIPPSMVNSARSRFALPVRSTRIAPDAFTDGVLKENAFGGPIRGSPALLNRVRSRAFASLTVPTVERMFAPSRS